MQGVEIEFKYLLRPHDYPHLLNLKEIERAGVTVLDVALIQQVYLTGEAPEVTSRIRYQYSYAGRRLLYGVKRKIEPFGNFEAEEDIDLERLLTLLHRVDPTRDMITKHRHTFSWGEQKFELDVFKAPQRIEGLCLLEIEVESHDTDVVIPDFLEPFIEREVTHDKAFSNSAMSQKPF
jgi:CYTH domain-containing protein